MINELDLGQIYNVKNLFLSEDNEILLLKNIYYALTEYENIESEYLTSINRIYSFIEIDNNSKSFLSLIINKIKDLFSKKLNHHLNLHNELKEICSSLSDLLLKETLNFETIKDDYLNAENLYKEKKALIDQNKNQYNQIGVKYINELLERINLLINSKKFKITDKKFNEKLNSFFLSKKDLKNSIHESTKNYINSINDYNFSIDKFISSSKESYNQFISIRKKYMNTFITSINKLIEKENNEKETISNSLNELSTFIKNNNLEKELNDFIKNNINYMDKPNKEEFIAFTSISTSFFNYDKINKQFNEGNQIIPIIKNYIHQEFPSYSPLLEHKDENVRKKYKDFQEYIIQAYEGKLGNNMEKIKEYFINDNNEQYIMFFLAYLNKIRSKLFNLSNNAYESIKEIFNLILNENLKIKNPEIIEYIIILSQTFYKNEKDSPRVLLQDDIKIHKIFKDKNLWIINLCLKLNKELKNININKKNEKTNVIYSALVTYRFNLLNFGFNDKEINDIFIYIFEKYDIKEEGMELLKAMNLSDNNGNNNNNEVINNEEKKE